MLCFSQNPLVQVNLHKSKKEKQVSDLFCPGFRVMLRTASFLTRELDSSAQCLTGNATLRIEMLCVGQGRVKRFCSLLQGCSALHATCFSAKRREGPWAGGKDAPGAVTPSLLH